MSQGPDMTLFFQVHRDLPREGPGNTEATVRAFRAVRGLPDHPLILDIGCGPGMQTLDLARLSAGTIVAVDFHVPFLKQLIRRLEPDELRRTVYPVQADMRALPFPDACFDLLWAEGSIFIAGVEDALRTWRRFLRTRGWLAFTELCWLRPQPPTAVRSFFAREYPPMKSIEENRAMIRAAGYRLVEDFVLPDSAWWDHYYCPLERRLASLRRKSANDVEVLRLLSQHQEEIDMFRRFSQWYGYVFYVCATSSPRRSERSGTTSSGR